MTLLLTSFMKQRKIKCQIKREACINKELKKKLLNVKSKESERPQKRLRLNHLKK